ncbi:alpha hydrolase-16 [Coleophoma crateriformis]|uniref:Palmitoyl-protein thioesterase 1 n=1 Tax=Coleophoma crateriformis TaxID=565419 RepID=A0A3D8T0N9_9HELO|nr:alpha hydrolase-16 [Coleophoma crateriformis]
MARFHLLSLLSIASLARAFVLHPDLPSLLSDDDDETPLPLVIWHGLGDNYAADGLKEVGEIAQETNPGTYVYNVRLDEDPSADRSATFLGNLTLQVEKVCADLAKDPILSTAPAIDALGFSQGGQFLRAYVERCNNPPVRSLVTFGSQHNGISEFQTCGATDWLCKGAQALLRGNTWSTFVQSRFVPAQYFRDPMQYEQYLENSNFLADINNERLLKNKTYKENMEKLENFVMYIFEDDTTVIPKETGWFSEVNGTDVIPLRERDMYKEDWLGLKTLDKKGALKFKSTKGSHMALTDKLLGSVFKEVYGPMKKGSSLKSQRPDALASYEKQLEILEEKNKAALLKAFEEAGVAGSAEDGLDAALAKEREDRKQRILTEQARNFAARVQREHAPKQEEL